MIYEYIYIYTMNNFIFKIYCKYILLVIYHDFLPPPMTGSHVKSDNTHTIINIHPLANIIDICALIFSSCALFTDYPNRIMKRHNTPVKVITTRAREGGPKEYRAKQKWPRETHSVTYEPWLSTLYDLSLIDAQPPLSLLSCPRPPSHHPSCLTSVSLVPGLHLLQPSTPFWPYGIYSSILSTCPNRLNTLWSALIANSLSILYKCYIIIMN